MLALGVDTSNYATSLAVVDTGRREVVCALKRFLPVKEGSLGLRQNDALFHHTVALPELLLELRRKAPVEAIGAVGVSTRPRPVEGSYMPCFLAGVSFAQALAAGRGLPAVLQTSHQQGHLAAALFGAGLEPNGEDLLFFHVSGGTTELLRTGGTEVIEKLGGSLDLHAGQLVDRIGVRMGFPFPAGSRLSELAVTAASTDAKAPGLKISVRGMECHLSGLQNQSEALLDAGEPPAKVALHCLLAIARSVQGMLEAARVRYPKAKVLCAGGVMGSTVIREYLNNHIDDVYFAPPELSADNAVGVALMAGGAFQRQARTTTL